jgi:GMP synthase-like glutamine amidotransferase
VPVKKKLVLGFSPFAADLGGMSQIARHFDRVQDVREKGFDNIDCLVLWGGTDINASFYGQKPHPRNQSRHDKTLDARDTFEKKAVLLCKAKDIPILGICRGAQLLCAMAGGKLIQDVHGHHSFHHLTTFDGKEILSNSCHHQMMYPFDVQHEMLAWTAQPRSRGHYQGEHFNDDVDMEGKVEPEIVFFPELRGLAVQGHPEWTSAPDAFINLVNNLIADYLLVKEHA